MAAVAMRSSRAINIGIDLVNNKLNSFSFSYGFIDRDTQANYLLSGNEYNITLYVVSATGQAPDIPISGFTKDLSGSGEIRYSWAGDVNLRPLQVGNLGVQFRLKYSQPGYSDVNGFLYPDPYSGRITYYLTNLAYDAFTARTPNVYPLALNTYLHIIGTGITFDSTFVQFNVNPPNRGIPNFSTLLVNTVSNVVTTIPSAFNQTSPSGVAGYAYYGYIPTSTLPVGSSQKLVFRYNGNTYNTGETITIVAPSMTINNFTATIKKSPPFGNQLTIGVPGSAYTDSATPAALVENINGRFEGYDVPGQSYTPFGVNSFDTDNYAYPGQNLLYGYKTPLAQTYQALFFTGEGYYTSLQLPGITYSTVNGVIDPPTGTPYYDFFDSLTVFGSKACVVPFLQVLDNTGATWGAGRFGPQIFDMDGTTHDLNAPVLMYNYNFPVPGQTFALPDIYLGLTAAGITGVSPSQGIARVDFTGVTFGQSFASSLYDGTNTISLVDGNGGFTYTGLVPGTTFGLTYHAVSGVTYSYNSLSGPIFTIKARPAVVTQPGITFSIQPQDYYVGLPINPDVGTTLAFNNDGGTIYTTGAIDSFGIALNDYVHTPYPNQSGLFIFNTTYDPAFGYKAVVVDGGAASGFSPGELDEFYILHGGETYYTGITSAAPVQASIQYNPPAIALGPDPGSLLLDFEQALLYIDTNYPPPNGIVAGAGGGGLDAGNVVSRGGVAQAGRVLPVPADSVYPDSFVPVGYQSTSAIQAAALYGGRVNYFLDLASGVTLPGITYTSVTVTKPYDQTGPAYTFNNLSVVGVTDPSFINNLALVTAATTTSFPIVYQNPTTATVQTTGITFDMVQTKLAFSGGGSLVSVPTYNVPLGGSVSVVKGVTAGTVVATLSGVEYGGTSTLTMRGSAQNERISVVGGTGTYVYTLTPGQTYPAGYFSYNAVIGLTLNYRALTTFVPYSNASFSSTAAVQSAHSLVGTITGTPGQAPGQVTLNFTGITYDTQNSGITLLGALKGELVPITGGTGAYSYSGLTLGFTLTSLNTYFNVDTPAGDSVSQLALSAPVVVPSHSLTGTVNAVASAVGGQVIVNITGVTYDGQTSGITLLGALKGELIPITNGVGGYTYSGLTLGFTLNSSNLYYNVDTPAGDPTSQLSLLTPVVVPSHSLVGVATPSVGVTGGLVRVDFTGVTYDGQTSGITLIGRVNNELIRITNGVGGYTYTGLTYGSTFGPPTIYYKVQTPAGDTVSRITLASAVTVPYALLGTATGAPGPAGGTVRVNFTGVSYNGRTSGITLRGAYSNEIIVINGGTGTYLYTGLANGSTFSKNLVYYNPQNFVLDTLSTIRLAADVLVPTNALFGTATGTQGTTGGVVRVDFTGITYNGLTSGITLIGALKGELIRITNGTGGYTYTGLTYGTVLDTTNTYYNVQYPTGDTISRLDLVAPVVVPVPPALPPAPVAGKPGQLTLDYLFTPTAGQTYTFNILGESSYTGLKVDQTINLNVSAVKLSKVIAYSGNWATPPGTSGTANTTVYQPEPAVALMLQEFVGPILDDLTKGLTGVTGTGISYPAQLNGTVVGTQGTSCNTLVKQFQSATGFTYHAPGIPGVSTDYLSYIPQEAVTSYNLTSINTNPLSGVVGNNIDNGNPGRTGPNPSKLGQAIQSLFEQAINLSMVQVTNEIPGLTLNNVSTTTTGAQGTLEEYFVANSTVTTGNPIYGASFTSGQELAIYVQYQLTKNRAYQLTPLADLAYAKGATLLNFGGVTFPIGGLLEESTPIPVTYKIVLHAI
jgi:hypothetical protein